MNTKNMNIQTSKAPFNLRNIAILGLSFFFIMIFLTAFIIIPKINESFEDQHNKDSQMGLTLEAELFTRFVDGYSNNLHDLARFPSLVNAVLLADGSIPGLLDIFDNFVIEGEKSRLILQDIDANILIKTTENLRGTYTKNATWFEPLLNNTIPYYFKLLGQDKDNLSFQISVPVQYDGFTEGMLSAEITVPLTSVFMTQSFNEHAAFKLTQDQTLIYTNVENISIANEVSVYLEKPQLTFTYITDDASIRAKKNQIRNIVLAVLFVGLFISLTLFAFMEYRKASTKDQVRNSNRSLLLTYAMPICVAVIGVIASISGYLIISNIQQAELESRLIADSKTKIQTLRNNINDNLDVLDSLQAFYNASLTVDRQEFKTFTLPFLKNNTNIQAIEWIPNIKAVNREQFEREARVDGFEDFVIQERDHNNNLITALVRNNYFPVYYVEPLLTNEKVLGFDLASNKKRLAALLKAKTNGNNVATSKINLIQQTQSHVGILVFKAIYTQFKNTDTTLNKSSILQGFIVLVLNIEEIVRDSLPYELNGLTFDIKDISNANSPDVIVDSSAIKGAFLRSETLDVAGRTWKVSTHFNSAQSKQKWGPWITLLCGLFFTFIIVLGLTNLIRQREIVEGAVTKRTAELVESEEQHRAVVDNAVDGLLTINEQGLIERFNHAAENIFGYSAQEVIGMNIKMLMPEPYHGEHDGYLTNYRNTGKKKIIGIGRNVEGKRKDGSIFPIDLSVSEISYANTRKFSGIVRDITERKLAEEEREKLINKLMDSNEELERFAFVCSHDLQEPLRMIRSFSEKLQDHISDQLADDEKGKKYFRFVVEGAIRSQALIRDILAYSSINSDTQKLEAVNLESIITTINDSLIASLGQNKVNITYSSLPILHGNKTQIFQLFQNLINNGIKYQNIGTIPRVDISIESLDEHWKFIIKDNGIGMEERHFKKIFEVFQRLHGKGKFAGTGVGLSICKKVVERHGGTIWVDSIKGEGSSFYFTLLKNNKDGEKDDN